MESITNAESGERLAVKITVVALLAMGLVAALAAPALAQDALRKPRRATDHWLDSWEAARPRAAREGKPIFLVFR